jgi:hypothetical protein
VCAYQIKNKDPRMSNMLSDNATSREIMRFHAIRRLWQRRGIILSDAEYEAIVTGIRAGLYKQIAMGEKRRPIYELVYRDKTVCAVFDREYDAVVTFLPHRTWAERNHRGMLRARADAMFGEARA